MSEEKNKEKKRLIVIDGNAVIHRAFHALPPLMKKNGELVNAVYGFLLVFFKAINDFNPDFVVSAFDFPAPSFRKKKYKLYKANRVKAPDELYSQIPKTKQILEALGVSVFEKEGYEADDLIGTISKTAVKKQIFPELEVIIVTGDMDALQLVDKKIKVYALRKGVKDIVLYDEERVREKYNGLNPSQLVDYKSLRGDPSDNIPGVFGIGEKTAISLLKDFESTENLYQEISANTNKSREINQKLKQKLLDYKDQAFVSKMLAQICLESPIDFKLENCKWGNYDKAKAIKIFQDYGFNSLIKKIDGEKEVEVKEEIKVSNLKLW